MTLRSAWLAAAVLGAVLAGCSSDDPSVVEPPPATATPSTSAPTSTPAPDPDPAGEACPDPVDQTLDDDIDGDGQSETVHLRAVREPFANFVGLCAGDELLSEVDVGGMAPSLAGTFDIDRNGTREVFVVDTSAIAEIYVAVTLIGGQLQLTTVLLERGLDSEIGEPFNGGSFHCADPGDGAVLASSTFRAVGDQVEVVTEVIGLDGLEAVVEESDEQLLDPEEAYSFWSRPNGCFD